MTAALAGVDELLPFGIDNLMCCRGGRHGHKKAIGVIEGGEHAAGIAIGIGKVTEPGMQEGVAVGPRTMLTVALVQRKHGNIIADFEMSTSVKLIAQRVGEKVEAILFRQPCHLCLVGATLGLLHAILHSKSEIGQEAEQGARKSP